MGNILMEQLHPEVEFSFGQVAKQPHEKTLTFTAVGDVFMPGTVHWSNGDCPAVDEETTVSRRMGWGRSNAFGGLLYWFP